MNVASTGSARGQNDSHAYGDKGMTPHGLFVTVKLGKAFRKLPEPFSDEKFKV